jgi:hypothetical protein
MEKEEAQKKLKELGIETENYYPKKTFMWNDVPSIGVFKRELTEDFYFYNDFNNRLYKIPLMEKEVIDTLEVDKYNGRTKLIVPLTEAKVIWEDKPFVELPDIPFSGMTLRHYACIHLKRPESGLAWLDKLIQEG